MALLAQSPEGSPSQHAAQTRDPQVKRGMLPNWAGPAPNTVRPDTVCPVSSRAREEQDLGGHENTLRET